MAADARRTAHHRASNHESDDRERSGAHEERKRNASIATEPPYIVRLLEAERYVEPFAAPLDDVVARRAGIPVGP